METIWTLVQFFVEGRQEFDPSKPSWTLWFLLALGIFRVVLPYLVLLRWPLLWALAFSVGVGYLTNIDNTSRCHGPSASCRSSCSAGSCASGMSPGLAARSRGGLVVPRRRRSASSRAWLAVRDRIPAGVAEHRPAILVLLRRLLPGARRGPVVGRPHPARTHRCSPSLLSTAFFMLMPRRVTWFTGFGQATMYIYLLHSFVLYPFRETGVLGGHHLGGWLAAIVLACIGISIALASPFVRRVFRPLIEPKPRWLFIPPGRRRSRPIACRSDGSRRPRQLPR